MWKHFFTLTFVQQKTDAGNGFKVARIWKNASFFSWKYKQDGIKLITKWYQVTLKHKKAWNMRLNLIHHTQVKLWPTVLILKRHIYGPHVWELCPELSSYKVDWKEKVRATVRQHSHRSEMTVRFIKALTEWHSMLNSLLWSVCSLLVIAGESVPPCVWNKKKPLFLTLPLKWQIKARKAINNIFF